MISLDFAIRLPHSLFPQRMGDDFFFLDRKLSQYKNLEIQVSHMGWATLFEAEIDLRWFGHDHAGPRLALTLFGLYACIQVYDGRHWNHEANRWERDDDDQADLGDDEADATP